MNKIKSKILNTLIDLYEKSKTFTGDNKVRQSFSIKVSKLFPKYDDDSAFDFYTELNQVCTMLEEKNLVTLQKERSGKIRIVTLNLDCLDVCYAETGRTPKSDVNSKLKEIWQKYENISQYDNISGSLEPNKPLHLYIQEQMERLRQNKSVQFFGGDLAEYGDLLLAVKEVLSNEEEIFIRELSVKLFNNSKRLEEIESPVRSLLYKYGEYDDKETVLEEHNIIKTPTYVMVKGCGLLVFAEQKIDLEKISGDIALSTQTLKSLCSVELNGASVITIENLTSFHKYKATNELVIYLGGFHNSVKRDFIKLVERANPGTIFKHFGDIDAGGFYILEHLKSKTGINFLPQNMDVGTLDANKENWISLSENDRTRLASLSEKNNSYADVIEYMLKNNCKLEQEIISYATPFADKA